MRTVTRSCSRLRPRGLASPVGPVRAFFRLACCAYPNAAKGNPQLACEVAERPRTRPKLLRLTRSDLMWSNMVMSSNVGIAELKAHLSEYVRAAQRGDEIIIKDRQ